MGAMLGRREGRGRALAFGVAGLALLVGCAARGPAARGAVATPAPVTAEVRAGDAGSRVAEDAAARRLDAAAARQPVAFLDRVGWGADDAELAELHRLGAAAWLRAQLRPEGFPRLPAAVASELAAAQVERPLRQWLVPLVREQRELARARRDGGAAPASQDVDAQRLRELARQRGQFARQAEGDELLLDLYDDDTVRERLVWFWMNHFNVFHAGFVGPMLADYRSRVIAPNALGPFAGLLRATMFSPQMLIYLNNAQNARGHINENYARELMELHTLGVGSGYTQADVTDLAHVLTGLGVDLVDRPLRMAPRWRAQAWQQGLVVFDPRRHDPQPERVLGRVLQGDGLPEIDQVLRMLATAPATARHVSTELARYYVGDPPPPRLVDAMARSWQRSGGDIARVMRTLFFSPEFAASLAQPQFKDPMRYVLSAARASFQGRIARQPQVLAGMLAALGEPLHGRATPDGYALSAAAWSDPGQMTTRFAIAQRFGRGLPELFAPVPSLQQTAVVRAQSLGPATLDALAQAHGPAQWNALWLSSPEFMNH